MKASYPVLWLVALLSLLCLTASAQDTETRNLAPFSRIKASASFDVILEKGSRESVRIETRNVDPAKVITEVQDGRLRLAMERGTYRRIQVKVYVTYRELEEIALSGSGNIQGNDPIQARELSIIDSGSGNITLGRLEAERLLVKLSGSANMRLAGRANDAIVQVSGSGNVEAYDLKVSTSEVRISGSGNVNLSVSEGIDASISGSGNVNYRGNPASTYVKTSGSGSIRAVH